MAPWPRSSSATGRPACQCVHARGGSPVGAPGQVLRTVALLCLLLDLDPAGRLASGCCRRWSVPACRAKESLVQGRRGERALGLAPRVPLTSLQIEVRLEYQAAVEREEQGAAPAARRRPVVDVLVGCGVVAQARPARHAGRKRVGRVAGERGTAGLLVGDVLDCTQGTDVVAIGVLELPFDRIGPAGLAGVHRRGCRPTPGSR